MNKKQFIISLVVVAVFSFLGGIIGGGLSVNSIFAGSENGSDGSSYSNPKKIDFLRSKLVIADRVITRNVSVEMDDDKTVIEIKADHNGNPRIDFFSPKKPKEIKFKADGKLDIISNPVFCLVLHKDEPNMFFYDKDFDPRIAIGIADLEPSIDIIYNSKTRMTIGTNRLVAKKTDTEEKVKGSICIFDNQGNLLRKLP